MDLFTEFMKLVTRLTITIASLIGAGLHILIKSSLEGSTRLPAQTTVQKREEDGNRRLAGCREVVLFFLDSLGYIARECMSREELEEKIDSGMQPDALAQEIYRRIQAKPGLILGTFGHNGYEIKQPFSVRDRHTYIVGKSGSGKTNLLRNMILHTRSHYIEHRPKRAGVRSYRAVKATILWMAFYARLGGVSRKNFTNGTISHIKTARVKHNKAKPFAGLGEVFL